jgi:hypothetical protein
MTYGSIIQNSIKMNFTIQNYSSNMLSIKRKCVNERRKILRNHVCATHGFSPDAVDFAGEVSNFAAWAFKTGGFCRLKESPVL